MTLHVPGALMQEIDALVAQGAFPSRDAAVTQLLRLGLDAFQGHVDRPSRPPLPPTPPLNRDPHHDEPISVDPTRPKYL